MFEDINDGVTHYDVADVKKGIKLKTENECNSSNFEKEFGENLSLKDLGMEKKETDINDIDYYDNSKQIKSIKVVTNNYEDLNMQHIRIEALKIAKDFSISIYSNQKDQAHDLSKCSDDFLADLFKDLDIVHKIADYNLKYILGSN